MSLAIGEIVLKADVLVDRVRIEGSYLIVERFRRSDDPRQDELVRAGITLRLPTDRWPAYRALLDQAAEEADLERALLPERRR